MGLSDANAVVPVGEILVYSVEVWDNTSDGTTVRIGGVPLVTEGIRFTLTDRLGSGIAPADFTGLNLYRSTDGALDVGDTFLKTEAAVVIGGAMLIDFTGVGGPPRIVPDVGSIFFLITADIAAGATIGGAFRFAAAGGHIDMRDTGGGPPTDYLIGTAIAANDANYIIISAASTGPSSSATVGGGSDTVKAVPFEHAWLLALLVVAYGVYAIVQRRG